MSPKKPSPQPDTAVVEEGRSDLPEGWVRARLRDVVESPPNINPSDESNREFGYIDISSICNRTYRVLGCKRLRGNEAPSRARRPVRAGDVLFSNVRTYLRNIALVHEGLDADVCSTGFTVLRPTPAIEPRFLFRYVLTDDFLNRVTPQQTGTHYPATSDRVVLGEAIPLPPLAEQKRIVAKVEELLARVNAARERLARVPAILKRFRQSILAAACSGRLTADWRENGASVEVGKDLLDRLLVERESHWSERNPRRRYKGPEPPQDQDDDLPEIPESWTWTNFDHCSWEITVGHVGPMRDRYTPEGMSFLRCQNIRPLRFDPAGLVHIPMSFHRSLAKSRLTGGEILVVRSGANTGDCCVFPREFGEANCADLVITRPLSGLLSEYGALYVSSPFGQARLTLRETGIAQPHFNIGAMRVKAFPLPPFAEQEEIARRVQGLFRLADAIERRMMAGVARTEKLTRAIIATAFRGELVPTEADLARAEGRSYVPASTLLARIRSSQTADPIAGKRTGRVNGTRGRRSKAK